MSREACLIVALLFCTQASALVSHCAAPVEAIVPAPVIELPMTHRGHFILDASVDGVSVPLVIDTGAMGVGGVIDSNVASQRTPGDAQSKVAAHGAHGSTEMQQIVVKETRAAGWVVPDLLFLVSTHPLFPNDRNAGLIGSRFLCQFLVELDTDRNTLRLHDRDTDASAIVDERWIRVPIRDFKGTGGVLLDVEVNGLKVSAVLDTGSWITGVNWRAAEAAGVSRTSPGLREISEPAHGLGSSGPVTTHAHEFDIRIGDDDRAAQRHELRVNDMPAMDQIFGDAPGMILGLDVLRGMRIVLDYQAGILYLQP